MACRDPDQFAARVGPVCGARGFRSRECREAIRDALRQHGDECLATPLVPGWPPLARYVCPSTDDYIGPLCPTHGRGGATPGAASAPAPGRRGHALQTAVLATLATGAGVGLTALGVAKSKLSATKRAIGGQGDSDRWGPKASENETWDQDLQFEKQLMNIDVEDMLADPDKASGAVTGAGGTSDLIDPGSGDQAQSGVQTEPHNTARQEITGSMIARATFRSKPVTESGVAAELREALPFAHDVGINLGLPDSTSHARHEPQAVRPGDLGGLDWSPGAVAPGPSGLDTTVEMASNLENPFELDPELDTLPDTGASTMIGVQKTNVHTDTKLNAYTPDTGASTMIGVLKTNVHTDTKLNALRGHENPKVRAFANAAEHTELLRTVAEYHASNGVHNRELREQYHAFKFPV